VSQSGGIDGWAVLAITIACANRTEEALLGENQHGSCLLNGLRWFLSAFDPNEVLVGQLLLAFPAVCAQKSGLSHAVIETGHVLGKD
jgi:hypothetical protein